MHTIEQRTQYGYPVRNTHPQLPLPAVAEIEPHGWWVEKWASGMGWTPVFFGTHEQAQRHLEIIKARGAWRDREPRLTPSY